MLLLIPRIPRAVRRIDQKLNVTNATLTKVPFDLERWAKAASREYSNGLPQPYSDDPMQWIFHGYPCGSVVWGAAAKRTAGGPLRTDSTVLQVALARLLSYRWPAEQDTSMELADEQRDWAAGCDALLDHADADGIVCIPPVRGERPALERLQQLLAAAFGKHWHEGIPNRLLAAADGKGRQMLEEGLIERLEGAMRPFISEEAETINAPMRRERRWHYPTDAVREAVVNALAHRDWTRNEEVEVARYADMRIGWSSPAQGPCGTP